MGTASENVNRTHALFICSDVSLANCVDPVRGDIPTSCPTSAGLIDWATGSMGRMNFGAPCRLRAEANLARWWGLRLQPRDRHIGCNSEHGKQKEQKNNFSMLALRHRLSDQPPSTVNGVICMAYTDNEMSAAETFYSYFRNASLVRVPIAHFEAVSWQSLPKGVDWVHCVVADDSCFEPPSYTAPILQSYLDDICQAFHAYGQDFEDELIHTTQGWSGYWLDDRQHSVDWGVTILVVQRHKIDKQLRSLLPSLMESRKIPAHYPANKWEPPEPFETSKEQLVKSGRIEQSNMRYFTFGMGSLINTPSRVGTAGAVAQSAIPVRISAEYEFCPCWNFQNHAGGSQLTAGGMILRSDDRVKNRDAETVGVIYPCPGDDAAMAAQDEREVGYTRYNIPVEFIHSLGHWQDVPADITVFQYVPNTELLDDHPKRAKYPDGTVTARAPFPPREYPLSQTYVDTCILGCLEFSREMARKWIAGFVGWPDESRPYWLNDRPVARRPWLETPKFESVDAILANALPSSLICRAMPAEYGSHYWENELDTDCVPQPGSRGCLAGGDLDVKYSSYSQCSREVVQATCQTSPFFFFETGIMMRKSNFDTFARRFYEYAGPVLQALPCRLAKCAGFRRSFAHRANVNFKSTMSTIVDAGDEDARSIIGMLYPAPPGWAQPSGEPPAKDERAELFTVFHRRVEIKAEHLTVLQSWLQIPEGARVFAFVCTEPKPPSFDYPISQMRLDALLQEGLESFGEDFCKEYVDTTDGWELPDGSAFWLNDRHLARRPWVSLGGKYKVFDRIILESKSALIPPGALFKRRLPEEYAVLSPLSPGQAEGGTPKRHQDC